MIGFGPGFTAGEDVHVAVETQRGHDLGRLIFQGSPTPDTGVPENIAGVGAERVVRAPCSGTFAAKASIADRVTAQEVIGSVGGQEVTAPIAGVVRGLIREDVPVREGMKIGDVDPRSERGYCFTISDKARALGGSALEAILMKFPR